MLLKLYKLIAWNSFIHKTIYWFIIRVEVPLIRYILICAGAEKVSVRNSILTPEYFHFLMSDIDLSVSYDGDPSFIYAVSEMVRKFLPNMGEIEIFKAVEWNELERISGSHAAAFWIKLNQLRKYHWLTRDKNKDRNRYHEEKNNRAITILLEKLTHKEPPFLGEKLFPEILNQGSGRSARLPIYSKFLEHHIGCDTQGINFIAPEDASNFVSVLPDSLERPVSEHLRQLKWYIMRRERLLAIVSLRTQSLKNPNGNYSELIKWIDDLDRRSSTLKQKSF